MRRFTSPWLILPSVRVARARAEQATLPPLIACLGDFDDARVHLERCVSSQPDHARGNEELARIKSIIAEREAQLALADVEEESMTGSYLTMGSEEDEEEAAMIAEVAEEMSPARGSGRVRVADDGEMDVGQLSDD